MATAPVHLVLDNTLGAMFIGVLLSAILYGISCLQMWHYMDTFRKDPWYLKMLVSGVFFCDTVHQALISHTVYYYLISNFDNPIALNSIVWSLVTEVLFTGFTALMVQGFFTYRIWRLSHKNIYLTVFVSAVVLGNFVVLLAYTIRAFQLPLLSQLPKIKPLSEAINIMGAITDVLIAAAMCLLLHNARSGFKRSDSTINRLMIFVFNTGLLTSVCAMASLISILAWPNAYIYITFFFMIGRLYNNSILAALNSRTSGGSTSANGRSRDNGDVSVSFGASNTQQRSFQLSNVKKTYPDGGYTSPTPKQGITISIDRDFETYDDIESHNASVTTRVGDIKSEV
ncbi:hypothetical protein PUNSTDRAFT_143881 [Punctularia strigosozonata HHB-11173 SS5]|uniref:uncharacterized protein n=1 Tax=Punctularia strigosozonata (strain HHB-11173) TaxID=741275 RepID=UPI0004418086|nr:uncharacterized protein PUNSTDRAFT_143881 [Punctularia strigosozonata HHB-11173 SS5]EIN08235.1 hypothetical protein PUNSTDRAFT_143881 [Punctularia strigosozonata HHB-11173 SS5]